MRESDPSVYARLNFRFRLFVLFFMVSIVCGIHANAINIKPSVPRN